MKTTAPEEKRKKLGTESYLRSCLDWLTRGTTANKEEGKQWLLMATRDILMRQADCNFQLAVPIVKAGEESPAITVLLDHFMSEAGGNASVMLCTLLYFGYRRPNSVPQLARIINQSAIAQDAIDAGGWDAILLRELNANKIP